MLTPFLVCLREGIEIFLIIIPLVVYFNKNKMYSSSKSIVKGSVFGTAVAVLIASVTFTQAALLEGPAGGLFDGLLGIVLSGLILYSVVLLRKNKSFTTDPSQGFISLSQKGLFILAAITFFRELLEATLFILTSTESSALLVTGSALLGLLSAALIVYVIAKGIANLNINIVFYILNLFLVAIGTYFFSEGLEVLFGSFFPDIFTIGVLVYAVPSYFIIIKKDLKTYLNSDKIK